MSRRPRLRHVPPSAPEAQSMWSTSAPRFNARKPNPGESRSPVGTEQGNLFLQQPTAHPPQITARQAHPQQLGRFPHPGPIAELICNLRTKSAKSTPFLTFTLMYQYFLKKQSICISAFSSKYFFQGKCPNRSRQKNRVSPPPPSISRFHSFTARNSRLPILCSLFPAFLTTVH